MLLLSHTNQVRSNSELRLLLRLVHTNSKYLRRYALCRRLKPGRGIVNSRVVLLLRSVEIKPLSYCMLLKQFFNNALSFLNTNNQTKKKKAYTICIFFLPLLFFSFQFFPARRLVLFFPLQFLCLTETRFIFPFAFFLCFAIFFMSDGDSFYFSLGIFTPRNESPSLFWHPPKMRHNFETETRLATK